MSVKLLICTPFQGAVLRTHRTPFPEPAGLLSRGGGGAHNANEPRVPDRLPTLSGRKFTPPGTLRFAHAQSPRPGRCHVPAGRGGGGASRVVGGGVWRAAKRRAAGTNGGAEAGGKSSVRRSREGKDLGRRRSPRPGGRTRATGPEAGGGSARGRQRPRARGLGVGREARARRGGAGHRERLERAVTTEGRGRAGSAPPRSPAASGGPWVAAEGVGRDAVGSDSPLGLPSVSPSVWPDLPSGWVCVGPSRLPPVGHRSTPPALPLPCRLVFLPVLFVPGLPVFPACPGSWPSTRAIWFPRMSRGGIARWFPTTPTLP